jgi:hypothetical protein
MNAFFLQSQVFVAVEPDVVKAQAQPLRFAQQGQGTADVVRVDVGHQKQIETTLSWRHLQDARLEVSVTRSGSAVDQDARRRATFVAVLDPQRVAVARRQHGDVEERQAACFNTPSV